MKREKSNKESPINLFGVPEPTSFLQHLLHSSDNTNIISASESEFTANNPLQFMTNAQQSIPPNQRVSEHQPTYYSTGSPHNEQQQFHNFPAITGIYHTSQNQGMSPPANLTPTSPRKSPIGQSGSEGARFTFPTVQTPQSISGYPQMTHVASSSPTLPALPETSKFPGAFGFELSFGPPTEGATKSIDYTYSHSLQKLYVQRGAHCPFKFKSKMKPPEGSVIKCLPVFKGTHVLTEPVKRCSNHAVGEEETGNFDAASRYHFIRSDNGMAEYESLENGRLCVTFPFTGPQVGAEFQTELLSFQCFNSCGNSAHAKRRIDIIFTLEHANQVLGRQVIEVRVCACPGRDRQNEEHNALGGQRKRRTSQTTSQSFKRKKNSAELYTVSTPHLKVYEILIRVQGLLDSITDNQNLEGQSLSPASNVSSPRRTQTVPESESEGECLDDDFQNGAIFIVAIKGG
eukprot:gene8042-8905_t